jgi:acyl dehydratase
VSAERFPVEAGHIMTFARSIGDFNPIYFDEAAARASEVGAIIAPPTFVQASAQYDPDYPLRPRPGVVWFGSGRTASGMTQGEAPSASAPSRGGGGGGGTGLHAEQHYEYHRPLRAGEVLTASSKPGRTWEKEGRRGGLMHFAESVTEYRGADGELVVTARSVGVRTAQPVKDA